MIAVIDYGAGNLASVRKALAAVGAELYTPSDPGDLTRAAGIIVPGVGHFRATARLDDRWRHAIREAVAAGCPLLGICLGMQWLFDGSDEAPDLPGLGIMRGRCARVRAPKVPHVGWNALDTRRPSALLDGLEDGVQMYFTHGYAPPVTEDSVATTSHGGEFASVVERGHVAGVQFHPEKSGPAGLRLLRNFHALAAHHRVP